MVNTDSRLYRLMESVLSPLAVWGLCVFLAVFFPFVYVAFLIDEGRSKKKIMCSQGCIDFDCEYNNGRGGCSLPRESQIDCIGYFQEGEYVDYR